MNSTNTVPELFCRGAVFDITSIRELKRQLCKVLSDGRSLSIDASRVRHADCGFVQFVAGAAATPRTGSVAFKQRDLAPGLGSAFARAGIASFAGRT